jgi:hypothetical protein
LQLKPLLPVDAEGKLGNYQFTVLLGKMRLFQEKNLQAAFELFSLIPEQLKA